MVAKAWAKPRRNRGGKGFNAGLGIQSRNRPSFFMHELAYRGLWERARASLSRGPTSSRTPTRSIIDSHIEIYAGRQASPLRKPSGMINRLDADGVKMVGDDADAAIWRPGRL